MKNLAAKFFFALMVVMAVSRPTLAGVPVVDLPNTIQATISAMQAVSQTAQQIIQYRAQLQQLATQLQNTEGLSNFQWTNAESDINNLINATNTIQDHINTAGSIQAYLKQFGDVADYQNIGCFKTGGCPEVTDKLNKAASEAQMDAANKAVIGINQQQTNLRRQAAQLRALEASAQGAKGQMQALQYANQFAGNQSAQLMQIHQTLLQQNAMAAAAIQAKNSQQALKQVNSNHFFHSTFVKRKHTAY